MTSFVPFVTLSFLFMKGISFDNYSFTAMCSLDFVYLHFVSEPTGKHMKKDFNIGLFNECFPPVMDGVSVCVQNYAYWLQKKVGGVAVITPNVPGASYNYDYEVINYLSMPVPFRHPYVTGIPEIDPRTLRKVNSMKFRIVHAHTPFTTGGFATRVAKSQKVPLVATFHSKYRDDFSRIIKSDLVLDELIKYIVDFYNKADQVWVPQASVIDVIRDYGFRGHVEVVDNGSDLVADYPESYFENARKALGVAPDEFVFLFVGQHIWEKNVRFIIDALEQIKDTDFKMFFVGIGYAAEEMKKLVQEKGLEDKVTFAGSITDREKMKLYYAAADLFLFPSLYDNAPLVVREAAALHTPSVMVKGATASTIIRDNENGFLIENDLTDFKNTLLALKNDRQRVREVGIRASHSIVRSWESVAEEVVGRYNDIISAQKLIQILK